MKFMYYDEPIPYASELESIAIGAWDTGVLNIQVVSIAALPKECKDVVMGKASEKWKKAHPSLPVWLSAEGQMIDMRNTYGQHATVVVEKADEWINLDGMKSTKFILERLFPEQSEFIAA